MRILLFLVFASLNFAFAASTQEKIKSSKNSLRSAEAMSQQLNKKLDDLAGDIVGGEQKLKAIGADIANLKQQISLLESNATSATGELEKLNAQNKELIQAQKELEQNIIAIIAEDLSFDLLLEQNETTQSDLFYLGRRGRFGIYTPLAQKRYCDRHCLGGASAGATPRDTIYRKGCKASLASGQNGFFRD